ncbi:MAG: hypothetical protein QXW62_06595 [Candidatus Methanomethylicaceae archaeon]
MKCKEIALILKKYFTILIVAFLLFSTSFLVIFSMSIYYLKDMPRSHFVYLTILLFIAYLIGLKFITDVLKKDYE